MRTLEDLLPILACPACQGVLAAHVGELLCTACSAHYPLIDGVPILLPNPKPDPASYRAERVSRHPYGTGSQALIDRHPQGLVLDLGAGGKDLALPNVVQLDIFKFPCTDVLGSADALPFKDGVFDAVVSQAVFEHLKYPEAAVREIWRVCKPGAEIKIDTAFLQPEHGYPDHYYNATQSGLRQWFRDFDLISEGVEDYQHPMHALSWFLGSYLDGLGATERALLRAAPLGEVLEHILDVASGRAKAGPIHAALVGLGQQKRRELAAGVSLLARKDAARKPSEGNSDRFATLQLEAQLSDVRAMHTAQREAITQLEQLAQVKQATIDALEHEYNLERPLRVELTALREAVVRKDNDNATLHASLGEVRQSLLVQEAALAHKDRNLATLQASIGELRQSVQIQEDALAHKDHDIATLHGEIDHLRQALDSQRQALETQRQAYAALERWPFRRQVVRAILRHLAWRLAPNWMAERAARLPIKPR